MSNAPLII